MKIVEAAAAGRLHGKRASPARRVALPVKVGQEPLDDLRQFLRFHRFVELHAVLRAMSRKVSVEISPVRMMTGNIATEASAQLRGDLQPVHAVRQIVVRK